MFSDDNLRSPVLSPQRLWMRPISFRSLYSIIKSIYKTLPQEGFEAGQVNNLILEKNLVSTELGKRPSPTILYHYRNTLLKLCIVTKLRRVLRLNYENPLIKELLRENFAGNELTEDVVNIFRQLVFLNADCRNAFLDLFMHKTEYCMDDFFESGTYVTWQNSSEDRQRRVQFLNLTTGKGLVLKTPNEIHSVLYGLRYWGRDELHFLDEFFREDRGAILYPIKTATRQDEIELQRIICESIGMNSEWTTLSVRDLALSLCVQKKLPLRVLFRAIESLVNLHSGYIALIPTGRRFAAIGARSFQREQFELRSYLKDEQGRLVSHIRLHRDLRRVSNE